MKTTALKNRIALLETHILFDYNGKSCGIDPITLNQIDLWYGDNAVTVNSVDNAMQTPLFDGKSLADICDSIQNIE